MKNSKINCRATINRFILLSLTLCYISTAYCSNKEQEIKQFLIYDAMSYIGKPGLSDSGLKHVYLMYEVTLTKKPSDHPSKVILDFNKIEKQAKLASLFPRTMISTDIEQWYYEPSLTDQEIEQRFDTLFSYFRQNISPNITIGNYGAAPTALCVHRYYHPKMSEDSILMTWRKSNKKRWAALKYADVAQPSLYIAEPNIESWIKDLQITVKEIKKHYPNKKIIAYIWPQYYDKKGSPYYKQFIPPHIWKQMLEANYTYCDGSIIWSSRTDENDQSVFWEDLRVQQIWEVTKHFIHSHKRQIVFPEKENLSILTSTPQEFNIYLNTNHPQLAQYGVQTIQMINEKDLGNCTNETFVLDVDKVKQFAIQTPKSSNTPICIAPINKKSDTLDYQEIYKLLKKDNGNQIWQIPSTSLGKLRLHNSNMHVNMGSWAINTMNSPQEPEKFTDAIIINAPIVDNDTITWKKELYITIKEAQFKSEGKPIYVYLPTTSLNNNYTIKATEWKTALKTAQQWCNGIIIHDINNNLPDTNTAIWQEGLKCIKEMKNTVA